MIYRIVEDTEENLIAFLPDIYLKEWKNNFCYVAIAQDEHEAVAGIVVFSLLEDMGQKLLLRYVYVVEKYRRQKIATILVQKTLDLMAIKGYKWVRSLICLGEDSTNVESFLSSLGFSKKDEFAVQMLSELGKIRSSNLYKQISEHQDLMSHVKNYDNVTYDQIEEFKKNLIKQQRIHINSSLDEEYTCFFVQDNRIIAASDFRLTSQNELERNFIYVLDDADRMFIFPTMIVFIVNKALEKRTKTTWIKLNVFAKSEYHGIVTTVGDYVTETPILIYERVV